MLARLSHSAPLRAARRHASTARGIPSLSPAKPPNRTLYYLKWTTAAFLTYHVFTEYFYSYPACEGISMLPTIASYGENLLISKHYRRGRDVQVGDLISFKHPLKEQVMSVKRVLGMPGDFVLRDTPGTSGVMLQVPMGHCWVVGDNLQWSRDSRMFGPVPLGLVKGKVIASTQGGWLPKRLPECWAEPEAEEVD